jgi:PAS domain S-box-containing protein
MQRLLSSRSWTWSHAVSSVLSRRAALVLTAALGAVLIALSWLAPGLADAPLLLFMFPVSLCAVRFGFRGGLATALLGIGITALWYLRHHHFASGVADLAAYSVAFLTVGALIGMIRDDRRMLERALAHHQEMSLDLVCTADLEGRFTWVNEAWTQTLGYTAAELCERNSFEFVHPDDQEATRHELQRQADEGASVFNFQNRYRASDGSYRWLEWVSRRDPDDAQLLAVARDVTERKHAEQLLANYRAELELAVRDRTIELESARHETLRRLALAAEFRDNDTYAHTERVGELSALIAQQLELPAEQVQLIRLASPLHDVGKLGIRDSILLKPAKLTPAEFAVMQEHTVDGAKILGGSSSDVLQLAEQIALSHHERWDGTGYPGRVAADAIPIAARIVALADVFDALTHRRPYKAPWPLDEALAEIRRSSGSHFDPSVVQAFDKLDEDMLVALTFESPTTGSGVPHDLVSA